MLGMAEALLAAVVMALIIIACRALPFLFFAGREPPAWLGFVEAYMPAIAMTVLAVSSFTSIDWKKPAQGLVSLVAGLAVILLHLWKRNALISIMGGTVLYLLLSALPLPI
ncbi:MAG TPA: branched-chain amino acid transport [Spirochaetaceae bacterium]|nr:branched-chain amino acid transport [Spirochaetaceae bacterium]